jgi:hypothetical protein
MNDNTTNQARAILQSAGFYPTPSGEGMMQDSGEQAAARDGLAVMIPQLTPGELLAVWVCVTSLLWRQSGEC